MKKILFYYKLFFAGGIESSILKLIRKLYTEYEIYVAYDDENSQDTVLGRIAEYATVVNLNNTEKLEVDTCIWCSHPKQLTFNEFSQKVEAKKYFCWGHILLFDTYPNFEFDSEFINRVERFICVSTSVRNDLLSKYPMLEDRSVVLTNYMDKDEILRKSEEEDFNIDSSKLNIITIARIARDKGFKRVKTLCDVFDRNNIKYNWYVLGKAYTQDVYDEIVNIFEGNENVHFLGYKNNVYPYLKKMNYLVLLSDREANNLSVSEAFILGIPCIVSNFVGVTDQVTDGKNGIILDLDNTYEKYNSRLNDIINMQKQLADEIAKKDQSKEEILNIWKTIL